MLIYEEFPTQKSSKNFRLPGIFTIVILLFAASAIAQTSITGHVANASNEPLPYATVTNKNSNKAVITNNNGEFTITAKSGDVIEASIVGYINQQITVNGNEPLSFVLQAGKNNLNEIVVVGYNTQSRRNLTSAVATVSGDELNKRVQTNPATLLQGRLPGLQVVQNSGQPGDEGVSLLIRGVGTFSGAGTAPLIIVDGLPGSLNILNPNDIESVSVLKDAASAAIYGSRGANGVIVIKTKKGRPKVVLVLLTITVWEYRMQQHTRPGYQFCPVYGVVQRSKT